MSSESGGDWSQQTKILEACSSAGPGLAVLAGRLYVAWKNKDSDQSIYYSFMDEHSGWSPQRTIPGVRTSAGPRLAAFDNKLYAAWKGADSDEQIYYAVMERKYVPGPQSVVPGVGTSLGLALATVGYGAHEALYAAWKGVDTDPSLYFAFMEKKSVWGTQSRLSNGRTSAGSALACFGYGDSEVLYAAWKGAGSDEVLYFSSLEKGKDWSSQSRLSDGASSVGPALAQYRDKLYAAWKGSGSDNGIYYASIEKGQMTWRDQSKIADVGSSHGPSLAVFDNKLYAAWKGIGSEAAIYYKAILE